MVEFLTIVHMAISVLLVVVVLLQFGRGAEAGFFSDTSSQGVFSGPGQGNILTRLTAFLAVVFLGLALYLAHLRGVTRTSSVFDQEVPSSVMETTPEATEPAPKSTNPYEAPPQKKPEPKPESKPKPRS